MALSPTISQSPAYTASAVTPSDSTVLSGVARGLWVGTGGDVAVTMLGGGNATFVNVPDGTLLPFAVTKVLVATTADDIIALY